MSHLWVLTSLLIMDSAQLLPRHRYMLQKVDAAFGIYDENTTEVMFVQKGVIDKVCAISNHMGGSRIGQTSSVVRLRALISHDILSRTSIFNPPEGNVKEIANVPTADVNISVEVSRSLHLASEAHMPHPR